MPAVFCIQPTSHDPQSGHLAIGLVPVVTFASAAADAQPGGDALSGSLGSLPLWVVAATLALAVIVIGIGYVMMQRAFNARIKDIIDGMNLRGIAADSQQENRIKGAVRALELLQESPAGVPTGTVRSILAFVIIFVGLAALLLQGYLNLKGTGEIAAILGTVLGFYFGTRSGSSDKDMLRNAQENARVAQEKAVETAQSAAKDAHKMAEDTRHEVLAKVPAPVGEDSKPKEDGGSLFDVEDIRKRAGQIQSIARIAKNLLPNDPLVDKASKAVSLATGALDIVKGISRESSASDIADAVRRAGALVGEAARGNPLGEMFSSALGSFGAVLKGGTGIAGLVGGPAGLIAAVALGAVQALKVGQEHYRRWIARVLDRPYTIDLFPEGLSDANIAAEALVNSPVFLRVYFKDKPPAGEPALAGALLSVAMRPDALAALKTGAPGLPPATVGPNDLFASETELETGLQEFRRNLIDMSLEEFDPNPVAIPAGTLGAGSGAVQVAQKDLRTALDLVAADPAAAQDLDRLGLLAEDLASDAGVDVTAAVREALAEAPPAIDQRESSLEGMS